MGKIKLTKKQILYDCAEWGACPESREFQKTLPDEIELKNWRTLGRPEFVAWYLHRAGRDWPNNRYIPAIAEALIATGDAWYLHRAGYNWPEDRYIPDIVETLIATGDAGCLYCAGRDWPNNRYIPAIAEALIATGDAGYLHRAGRDWPVDRAKQLKEVNHELLR